MKAVQARTRIQLTNILFTTDFSAPAALAAPYAGALAKRYGAKLYALHVHGPVVNPMTPPASWPALEQAAAIAETEQRRGLGQAFAGIETTILIKEGALLPRLRALIASNSIDMIVMGTRGRTGAAKILLGSVAEEILRQVACPVLTVGPKAPEMPKQGEFTEIIFATDFTPESLAAAPYAISLAQEFQANLTLLHVIEEPKVGELVRAEELEAASGSRLRELVGPEVELWCTPHFEVERGPAAERILDVAQRRHADLIVLGVRGGSGVPGAATHLPIAMAHKLVSHAACPVLTVRG
jgi:nucleotide-binding universal stress UspA family protein